VNPPPPVVGENFLLTSPFIELPDQLRSPDLAQCHQRLSAV